MTDQTKLAEIKRDLEARSHNYGAYYCVDDMAIIARQLLAMLEPLVKPVDDAEIQEYLEHEWKRHEQDAKNGVLSPDDRHLRMVNKLLCDRRQQQQTIAAAREYVQKQDLRTLNRLKWMLGGGE